MNALRWLLLISAILGAASYAILMWIGLQFRASFGAEGLASLLALLPIPAVVLIIASLRMTANRTLLHITAVVVVSLIGLCIWQIQSQEKSDPSLMLTIVYMVLWLIYYGIVLSGSRLNPV